MKSFLKICPIFLLVLVSVQSFAQIIAEFGVDVQNNNINTAEALILTENDLNTQFVYWSEGDTLNDVTSAQVVSGEGTFQQIQSQLDIDYTGCGTSHFGYWRYWFTDMDTLVTDTLSWSFVCPGPTTLGEIQVVELSNPFGAIQITIPYEFESALGDLYFDISLNGQDPQTIIHEGLFGEGVSVDTLVVGVDIPYLVDNFQAIGIGFISYAYNFVDEFEGVIEPLDSEAIDVNLIANIEEGVLHSGFEINTTGSPMSSFTITIEKIFCDESLELFDQYNYSFNTILTDSTINLPNLSLPGDVPAWRINLFGDNGEFIIDQEEVIDVTLSSDPTISFILFNEGDGDYMAQVSWDDDGAGDPVLECYIDGTLFGQFTPDESPYNFQIEDLDPYENYLIEIQLHSNACVSVDYEDVIEGDEFIEPFFETSGDLWDDMWAVINVGYNLGSLQQGASLRITHLYFPEGGGGTVEEIFGPFDVIGSSYNFDLNINGLYGTHKFYVDLMNSQTLEIYETVGPFKRTFQSPVSVQELNRPVTRFDRVIVTDISGRVVQEFGRNNLLQPDSSLPVGIYIFIGIPKEGKPVSSKISLGQ